MIMSLVLTLAASGAAPAPFEITSGKDYHFGADAHTSASYLRLMADGHYVVVDTQHMFTEIDDEGQWQATGQNILLESDYSVRDIEVDDFKVYIFDRCGEETLPELRDATQALVASGKLVPVDESGGVIDISRTDHALGRGPNKSCGATLVYSPDEYPPKPLRARRLGKVVAAIDAWLADAAAQHIFEYRSWEYRGERFLEPLRPGMHAVQEDVRETKKTMDRYDGHRAPYVYYAISAEEYAKRANCTYAFKFHPQMNAPCND